MNRRNIMAEEKLNFIYLSKLSNDRDLYFLYQAMSSGDQFLYSTQITHNSEKMFYEWIYQRLDHEFHDFYLVKKVEDNENIGFVHNYDFSLKDGHCKLVVYISSVLRDTGIGGIAAILFMKQLFKEYPLKKLYSTIYDYNSQSLESNIRAGFKEEGVLKKYRYYDGAYHNLHYLTMTREQFENTLGRLV